MALTFPSSPVDGQLYVDTGTGNRYIYDSGKGLWKYASNNVGMTVGTAPPPSASVAPGAMWYNTNTGRTFILYDDGDSRQWVENVPAVGSFDSSTVAGYANAAVLPAVTPAYNTANAAFAKANTALQNTSGTFSGTLGVTGNLGVNNTNPSSALTVGVPGSSSTNTTKIGDIILYDDGQAHIHSSNTKGLFLQSVTGAVFINQEFNGNVVLAGGGGKVGIGNVSPSYKLHVNTGASGGFALFEGLSRKLFFEDSGDSVRLSTEGTGPLVLRAAGSGGNHLAIDSSGRITMPNQPCFYASAPTSRTSAGDIVWNTVAVNVGSYFNGTNGRFTAPVAGNYMFICRLQVGFNGGYIYSAFRKNGTQYSNSYYHTNMNGTTQWQDLVMNAIIPMAVNDYVTAYWDNGTTGFDATNSQFIGHLIG